MSQVSYSFLYEYNHLLCNLCNSQSNIFTFIKSFVEYSVLDFIGTKRNFWVHIAQCAFIQSKTKIKPYLKKKITAISKKKATTKSDRAFFLLWYNFMLNKSVQGHILQEIKSFSFCWDYYRPGQPNWKFWLLIFNSMEIY